MNAYFQDLYELFKYEDLLLIGISIIIGLVVGAEREYKNKTAGLRTLMLVSVGSCTFTILSLKIGVENPDRLAANIITGIGFLGAGAIFRDENKVSGLTTACTIWVTAALGMCVGSGHIYLGLLSTTVVLMVLWSLVGIEQKIQKRNKIMIYKVSLDYSANVLNEYEKQFVANRLSAIRIKEIRHEGKLNVTWQVKGNQRDHERMKLTLFENPAILRIEI